MELARLLIADFDVGGVAIAAQPFRLWAWGGDRVPRHAPDFMLVQADEAVRVVSVKPADNLAEPQTAEVLASWVTV